MPIEFDGDGELWALMLDAKRTWDEVIERHAGDEKTRDAVLQNRIYQELSNAVAGSTEYMAMEKLYELYQEDRYDLLVLDTPPTRNALDFLDAPQRLSRFIDSRSLQFFLKPGRFGLKVLGRGGGVPVQRAEARHRRRPAARPVRLLQLVRRHGAGHPRARRARRRAAGRPRTFLVVTSPQRDSIDEAIFFRRRLREGRHAVRRRDRQPRRTTRSWRGRGGRDDDLSALLGDKLAGKVTCNYEDYRELAQRDHEQIERLRRETSGEPVVLVPHLDDDVHDADGLPRDEQHLFAEERSARIDACSWRTPAPCS